MGNGLGKNKYQNENKYYNDWCLKNNVNDETVRNIIPISHTLGLKSETKQLKKY